jgi:hypothetical protein
MVRKLQVYYLDQVRTQISEIIVVYLLFIVTRSAYSSKYDMLNELLEYGADPILKDNEGNTSLFLAVERNDIDIVRLFLPRSRSKYYTMIGCK